MLWLGRTPCQQSQNQTARGTGHKTDGHALFPYTQVGPCSPVSLCAVILLNRLKLQGPHVALQVKKPLCAFTAFPAANHGILASIPKSKCHLLACFQGPSRCNGLPLRRNQRIASRKNRLGGNCFQLPS